MRTTSLTRMTIVVAACVSLSNVACAESLFQKLPEPGQWCRYQTILFAIREGSAVSMPEQRGELTVSALDVVEHDGVPHQWIEITNAIEVTAADAEDPGAVSTSVRETMTYKCLIQRDQLQAGGDPLAHIARGWLKRPGTEATESNVESFTGVGQEALILMFVMTGPLTNPTDVTVPNSASIGDDEFETSEGVAGALESVEIAEGMEISGDFSYWTHDSAGFGVPASEFLLSVKQTISPNSILNMQIAVQLEISNQGDGAVSKLPDHE